MLTDQIVALLIAERDQLNKAIEALGGTLSKRRGRPLKSVIAGAVTSPAPAPKKRGRSFTAAQRRAAAERMKARWAAKKKVEGKPTKKAVKTA